LRDSASYAIRNIGCVRVKGKSDLVTIYEVFDADAPEIKEGKLATLPVFLEALYNYAAAKHQEAAELFADCVRKNPMDKVAQNYLQRCQEMQVILSESRSDFL
jgi:adenylate cyclase